MYRYLFWILIDPLCLCWPQAQPTKISDFEETLMSKLPELYELLAYQNPRIINRYQKDYPSNTLLADDAFTELLKFLWLCQKHRQDIKSNPNDASLQFSCTIHAEMKEIDDMWHTFLLFTRDYSNFCNHYFGHFLHHDPISNDSTPSIEQFENELTNYLSYAYDHLGEETIRLWFSEFGRL
jgi:hypothetical protein